MSPPTDRTESVFAGAVALSAENRADYLDRECINDPVLRKHVDALLRAHERSSHMLDHPVPGGPEQTVAYAANEKPGTVVAGRYKLLEAIGEGGMGSVWVAEQTEPVRRKVALKLIKAGMDSRSVLARFEAERQALAMMDHPNIAKVLDGGLTDQGRPYFVMEYVKGVPITEYCDATRLSVDDRLKLFMQVCQAVQHAHQKGIIHRDLKPSNILVAPYDDKPVPKIIDFGLAKAMHQSLTERTLHTAHESVLGTPLYMSPEQAQLNNLDVDTRSDIYSLGVLLYELLTGTTPLEKQRFKQAAWDEVRRIIREEEPPRPSTRLSSIASLPSLAAGRQTEPVKLTRLVRGELDWIVMKALEKDRMRRYETANGFARDIQRYLSDEVVEARPVSAGYRLRKLVSRNKGRVLATALVFLALLSGMAVSTWQAVRATQAEHLALQARQAEAERAEGERLAKQEALSAVEAEKQANVQAQKRLTQIEKANDILGSIFENLNPKEIAKAERPLQAILVEKLDKAVAQLEGESIGDALVVAVMQVKFGNSLWGLGEPGKAIVLLEKARATRQTKLGPEHPDTLQSMNDLAVAYRDAGKLDLALPLHEETLRLRKAKLGPEHPDTLISMNNLASAYQDAGKLDLALPLHEETLKLMKAKLGPEHPDTLTSMNNLAGAYQEARKLDLALPLFEETLKLMKAKLGPEHPDTLSCVFNLAGAYQASGKLDLALPLMVDSLKLQKAKLGPEHPDTLLSMNNLAESYRTAGKLDLALPLHEETLKLRKAKFGPDHPTTFTSMNNLALAYLNAEKPDLALPLLEETLKLMKAKLGPDHPDTLIRMNNLAEGYRSAGKLDLALPLHEETLKLRKAKLGPDHLTTLTSMNNLATAYQDAGKPDLALPLHEETLKFRKAKLGPDHPTTLTSMNNLATAYQDAGKPDLALPLFEETLTLTKAKFGPEHPDTLNSINNLATAYRASGKLDLALLLFEETLKLSKAKFGAEHPETLTRMNNLASTYQAAGKLDLALSLHEETLKLQKAKLGPEHPNTLTSMNNLAATYWSLKRLDKSIPLFEELLPMNEKKLGRDHPNTLSIVANLGVNYKDAGRLKEAIPLLEETYRASQKHPPLRWVGNPLLDGYLKTGKSPEAAKLIGELLNDARKQFPKDSPKLAGKLAVFSMSLLQIKQYIEAETLFRECLAIREKMEPDDWTTFNTKSLLGGALLGQKKYADAEQLLLAGYDGMKQREKTIPPQGKPHLPEALDRLIQLYTETNKPDEVKKWQAEKDNLPKEPAKK